MHPEDLKSRATGVLCLGLGTALTWWSRSSVLDHGLYSLKAALVGPTVLVLGLGLLLHGRRIPTSGVAVLTRIYGVAGGLATVVNLYWLGFFSRPHKTRALALLEAALPFLMLGVWFLPSRVFGPPPDPEDLPAQPSGPSHEPLEPR